jgi:hypothetical protein
VLVGGEDAGRWTGMDRQFRAMTVSPVVRQQLRTFVARERREELESLTELIESAKIPRSSTGPTR